MRIKKIISLLNDRNGDEHKKSFSSMSKQLNQIIEELRKFDSCELIEQSEFKSNKNKNKINLFNSWNAVVEQINEFCSIWIQKENLRAEYDGANLILTAYYENGQILDYLERINRYISELVEDENPIIASKACYNNYIFFLAHFMEDLKETHKTLNFAQTEGISQKEKTNQWIIDHECNGLSGVKELKMKILMAETLQKKITQQAYTSSDEESFRGLTEFWDLYSIGCTGLEGLLDEDVKEMKEQTLQVNIQISNMKSEIQKAEELYQSLISVLSAEWFEQFKPIESGDGTATGVELINHLTQAMNEVNEKILNVYTRK